jgi:uncharacterized protein
LKGINIMRFSGTETIAVPIERAWAYLADMQKVATCGPGFQGLEKLGPEHWRALVAIGIGPVKAKFTMHVIRTVLQKPDLIVIKVHGKAPGSAMELEGRMRLTAIGEEQTNMHWVGLVAVSGMLATVGTRLINTVSERLIREFFACLKSHLQAAEVSSASALGNEHE